MAALVCPSTRVILMFVAMGANRRDGSARRLHYSYGPIGMTCYAFGAFTDTGSQA
jgi:hypothetical protein